MREYAAKFVISVLAVLTAQYLVKNVRAVRRAVEGI